MPIFPSCINQYGVSGSLLSNNTNTNDGIIMKYAVILQDRKEPKIHTNNAPIVIKVDGKMTKLALMSG